MSSSTPGMGGVSSPAIRQMLQRILKPHCFRGLSVMDVAGLQTDSRGNVIASVISDGVTIAGGMNGVPISGMGGPAGLGTLIVVTKAFGASPFAAALSPQAGTVFRCSAGAGADFVFNLPAATGSGQWCVIKKMDANAHNIAVTPNGGDTIDGANAAVNVAVQNDALWLCDTVAGAWDSL